MPVSVLRLGVFDVDGGAGGLIIRASGRRSRRCAVQKKSQHRTDGGHGAEQSNCEQK